MYYLCTIVATKRSNAV